MEPPDPEAQTERTHEDVRKTKFEQIFQKLGSSTSYVRTKGKVRGQSKFVRLLTRGDGGFKVTYVRKKIVFNHKISKLFFFVQRSYYIANCYYV